MKMASKGKNKLKGHQIMFRGKIIDIKRFAYDMFVYSAKKFYVQENCIYKWEGPDNDYRYPDFCPILFIAMIRFQIPKRYTMYRCFNRRYEANKFQLDKEICDLFLEVFKMLSMQHLTEETTIFERVEASLAVASDLIIFLYSKNESLYVKKLVDYWFEHFFRDVKKDFESSGGFEEWYRSCREDDKKLHEFCDNFIFKHCSDYEKSANDEDLEKKYYKTVDEFYKQLYVQYPFEECMVFSLVMHTAEFLKNHAPPPASRRAKASRSILTANPGLGITPHEELLQKDLPLMAGATSSQIVAEESPQKPSRERKGSSSLRKRRPRQSSLCSSLEPSGTKQLSGKKPSVLVTDDKTTSQNIPSTRGEVPALRTGSPGQQKSTSSTCSSLDQGLRQLSLESSGTKQ